MTVPFKGEEIVTDSYKVLVEAFTYFFFFATILPLVFFTAFALAEEKEAGFQRRIFYNGLNTFSHFASWLVLYTVLAITLALLYTAANKTLIFPDDDFGLVFLFTFVAVESLFSFVWMLRNFTQTSRMAMIVTLFFIFMSIMFKDANDQPDTPLSYNFKRFLGLSPLTAIKWTIIAWADFHSRGFSMTFENWDTNDSYNWSI